MWWDGRAVLEKVDGAVGGGLLQQPLGRLRLLSSRRIANSVLRQEEKRLNNDDIWFQDRIRRYPTP